MMYSGNIEFGRRRPRQSPNADRRSIENRTSTTTTMKVSAEFTAAASARKTAIVQSRWQRTPDTKFARENPDPVQRAIKAISLQSVSHDGLPTVNRDYCRR